MGAMKERDSRGHSPFQLLCQLKLAVISTAKLFSTKSRLAAKLRLRYTTHQIQLTKKMES